MQHPSGANYTWGHPSLFFPQGGNRIFTCSMICGLLKKIVVKMEEKLAQVTLAQEAMHLDFFFLFLLSQTTMFTWSTKYVSHRNRWYQVQSKVFNSGTLRLSRFEDLVICTYQASIHSPVPPHPPLPHQMFQLRSGKSHSEKKKLWRKK